jgi:hypothetical protein
MSLKSFSLFHRPYQRQWFWIGICSILITIYLLQHPATTIDIQNNQSFHEVGMVEASEYGAFRWTFPQAQLTFPSLWIDRAWFPSYAISQIVELRLHDYFANQSLQVGNTTFAIATQPRVYHMLTQHTATIALMSLETGSEPSEHHSLGVMVFAASRISTILTMSDVFVLWVQVLLVCSVFAGIARLFQYIVATPIPLWGNLAHVGIWLAWWVAMPEGNAEFLLGWGFVGVSLVVLRWVLHPWQWSWPLYFALLLGLTVFRIWMVWWYVDVPTRDKYLPLPFMWEPYWSITLWLLILVGVRLVAGKHFLINPWAVTCAAGCALFSMDSGGYWPALNWMTFLPITYLGDWPGVWEFLRTSRVAIPPLLLIVEFAIHGNELLMHIYRWIIPKAFLFTALCVVVFRGVTNPRERLIRGILLMIWAYAFTKIQVQSGFFVYDFFLGSLLLFAVHLAFRDDLQLWQWGVIGMLLVVMDSMRPFGMLILAIVTPWLAIRSWRIHHIRGLLYLCLPLLLSVFWHGHHIINLGQLNWSNHTGFNFCNAWECPKPPNLLAEAPALAERYWPNINTEAHEYNSRQLLKSGLRYQIEHPTQALARAGTLLYNIISVPYTYSHMDMPTKLIGNGWWNDVYRLFMFVMMILQSILGIAVARMTFSSLRSRIPIQHEYLVGHTIILLLVLVMPNMVEFGENYRFIVGAVMWLAALPSWHEYHSFVTRWIPLTISLAPKNEKRES